MNFTSSVNYYIFLSNVSFSVLKNYNCSYRVLACVSNFLCELPRARLMILLFLCICQRVFSSGGVRREPSTIWRTDADRLLMLRDRSDMLLSRFCLVFASSRSLMAFFLKSPQLTGLSPLLTYSQQYYGRTLLMVLCRFLAFCFRLRWWSICSSRCFLSFCNYSAKVKTFRCCWEQSEAGVDCLWVLGRLQTYFNLAISSCSYPNSLVFSLRTISFIFSSSLNSEGSFLFIRHSLYPQITFNASFTSLRISSSFNLVRESNCEPGVRVSRVRWLGMRGFRSGREGGMGAEEGGLERGRGGLMDGDRDSLLIIIVEWRVRSASKKRKHRNWAQMYNRMQSNLQFVGEWQGQKYLAAGVTLPSFSICSQCHLQVFDILRFQLIPAVE